MADFLADNIRVQDAEPHAFLDGKLVVAPKRRVSEIGMSVRSEQARLPGC